MKKKLVTLFLTLFLIFSLTFVVKADTPAEDETYLTYYVNGMEQKVYHYGKGGALTVPKTFDVYESEMRGVWVATVYNIAIGKQNGTTKSSIDAYKKEFLTILDRMEEFGMNTLFFQIRPSNDAFYKSELNPWSEFLVGAGVDPGWDPLEWMIEETHKRGFDFQCWMNAYRVTTESVLPDLNKKASYYSNDQIVSFKEEAISKLADNNFAKLHPEYVVVGEHDTRLTLNPSEVAVQDFIVATLKEIIENYDIDGMHFDDYFYLNGETSSDKVNTNFAGGTVYDEKYTGKNTLNDLANYQEYLANSTKYAHMERGYSLGEFRRENINVMMRKIRAMVDEYNEKNNDNVEFGSKPAAVWRSNSEYCDEGSYRCSPNGSLTAEGAYSSYSDLFADTWKWVEEGLVDYVAPQVYYAFIDSVAAYGDIVDWWATMVDELNQKREKDGLKKVKLYIAHGIYKYRDAATQFFDSGEIMNQLKYNKKYDSIVGSAFYSYENLYIYQSKTHENAVKYLRNNWTKKQVYPIWRGDDDSAGLKVESYQVVYDKLSNEYAINFEKMPKFRAYGVYKVPKGQTFDSSDLSTRIQVVYDPYENPGMASIVINDFDSTYDYYLKVVSTNGYVSSETTKLEFSNIEEIESLKVDSLTEVSSEVLKGSKITGTAKITNVTGKALTYKITLVQNGSDLGSVLASGDVVGDEINYSFNAFNYQFDNMSFKFEITDGKVSTYLYSNTFNIVDTIKINYTTEINKYKAVVDDDITIKVKLTDKVTMTKYQVRILDKDKNELYLLADSSLMADNFEVVWHINDANNETVYVQVVVGGNSYISDAINISTTSNDDSKGCKCATSIHYAFLTSTLLSCLVIFTRKKQY